MQIPVANIFRHKTLHDYYVFISWITEMIIQLVQLDSHLHCPHSGLLHRGVADKFFIPIEIINGLLGFNTHFTEKASSHQFVIVIIVKEHVL